MDRPEKHRIYVVYEPKRYLKDIYVGCTAQELRNRLREHCSHSKSGGSRLYHHMRERGADHFKVHLLEEVVGSRSDARVREAF